MTPRRRFAFALAGFVALYFFYGARRFALGVDFTDEGVYVAWPLRVLFGEPPFSGDPLLAMRPMFNHLAALYRLHPDITLYELRLLGWTVHLAAFSTLACCLFRLTGAPLRSLLLASVPLFLCHIFGHAPLSYNSTSGDFLLIALSLHAVARHPETRRPLLFHLASGLALFTATFVHPALGLVAVLFGFKELLHGRLLQNLARLRLSPPNAGFLAFTGAWLVYVACFLASGDFATWLARSRAFRSARIKALEGNPAQFFLDLLSAPFVFNPLALVLTAASLVAVVALRQLSRRQHPNRGDVCAALALLLLGGLIAAFRFDQQNLPLVLVLAALVALILHFLPFSGVSNIHLPDLRFLLSASLLGALAYATTTFYFSPLRSWISGTLALPFAFAAGVAGLLGSPSPARARIFSALSVLALALAVVCVAQDHYTSIFRDAPPARLTAAFRTPKLHAVRSTPERVHAVDALHDHLQPKLARGEPLLAFDDCPLVYFLLDARPAYALTWATRYTQTPASLVRFDAELRAAPLPRYAIRTLVDISHPRWSVAPATSYANYPLNTTLLAHYELEATFFPFEVWRLRTP